MTAIRRCLAVLAVLVVATYAQHRRPGPQVQATNRFNFFDIELLKAVISQAGEQNLVISPASTKAVLGMLLEGAEGESANQIERTLRLHGNKASHQMIFKSFLSSMKVRYPGSLVELANQIFLNSGVKVKSGYKDALEQIYYSGVHSVDFADSRLAATTINGWVAKNTHGLIRYLTSPEAIDRHTTALVANVLYFKGKWEVPFNPRATTVRCFHPEPNMCRKAFFMETVGQHGYADLKDLNAKALEIYYQGSKFSMLFLLPNNGLEELLRDLSYQPLNTIIPKLEQTSVVVSIPRFLLEFKNNLIHPLMQLGIKDIFTPAANLSGMTESGEKVLISQFLQKAVIEVNEEGTVGAAATGAFAVPLQGSIIPKFQASRPFLFFVRDLENGHYLFEGLVVEPELALDSDNIQPNAATAERSPPLSPPSPIESGTQVRPNEYPTYTTNNYNVPTNSNPTSNDGRVATASRIDSINYPV